MAEPGIVRVNTDTDIVIDDVHIEVIFYIWHSQYISGLVTEKVLASQAPICSLLIYNPERRQEAWRFLTYQFVHVNMEHIVFNTLMQLVVGLPLEMSQPGYRGTLKVGSRAGYLGFWAHTGDAKIS